MPRRPATRPATALAALGILAALTLSACGSDDSDNGSAVDNRSSSAPSSASGTTAADPSSDSASDSASTSSSADASGCDYVADPTGQAARKVDYPPETPDVSGTVTAELDTSIGAITFTLDAASAPCTVNSFVSLAKQGYFDLTTCHRLTEGDQTGISVLQCGDPTGSGFGGPGYTIPDELEGNTGDYPAGTLAMANTGQPHSGGSQFFIVYGPSQLGPLYSIFGTVDATALSAIQQVAQDGTDNSNGQGDGKPNTAVDITSVTIS